MVIAIAAGRASGANPAQADALVDRLLSTWSRRVIALPPADVPDDSLGDLLETLALLGPVGPGAQRPVRGPLIPLTASIRIDALSADLSEISGQIYSGVRLSCRLERALSGPLLEDWLDWPEPPPAGAAAGAGLVVGVIEGWVHGATWDGAQLALAGSRCRLLVVHYTDGFDSMPQGEK
ncbi:MAG: hypothetical protein KAY22_18590 [Rhizorhabdus sp.]|uniref:hypothetical protein n=1 Tax=Rhizorhabdus sp. TaxID=1968843 RepID=UPI001B593BCA|nr:hypothetical protein [Rhizorhabdus sp.]MBP8234308.1 hypothetical protein [Rhizorhabdus sp.]